MFRRNRTYAAVLALMLLMLTGIAASQQIITGQSDSGAQYKLAMPATWNGILVVYAHGIIDPQAPIALPADVQPLEDALLANGFAMAYSSFSANGYAVKEGINNTHALSELWEMHFLKPRRTILMGHSLGALVIVALAEQHPKQYDGALPMCGVLGGSIPEIQYVGDARALYDAFFNSGAFGAFPYILPGTAGNPVQLNFSPGSEAFNGVLGDLMTGYGPPYYPTAQFAATLPLPVKQDDPSEVIAASMYVVGFDLRFGAELLDRTHERIPFSNALTLYKNPLTPILNPLINAVVERYSVDPRAFRYLDKYYTPTGQLQMPMITLHTTRDPAVPIWHEDLYRAQVEKNGAGNLLLQNKIDRYGHCAFTNEEMFAAFQQLVTWVEARPARERETNTY